MMSPEQEQEQLDALARVIKQRTEAAFEELMTRLQSGEDPRTAMEAVTSQFHGQYYDELSAAFSAVLDRAIGSTNIRSWPVSDVALSERLYRHTAEVNAVTRQIIKDHVKGFVQARELAMQIYEGYGFKDDPLKVQVNLPKYLREALQDPAISQGFAQIVGRIRADNLKTPALKAAYLQAIDALEAGAGGNRLKKLMQTAWFERNRYFANRIAQTELHRAYSNQVAQEIMADEAAVWVKYQMSKTHPKADICDRHAGVNGWGKGPGIYPKAQAPKPPAHPFCRCTVRPAYEVEGEPGKPVKDAEQRFMNRRSDYDQRLIAGSRDRLQQFRDGRSLESIYNEGKNPIYRWGRVGDGVEASGDLYPQASQQPWQLVDSTTATLDEIKTLGSQRLDEFFGMKTPDDRALFSVITDRGRTLREIIETGRNSKSGEVSQEVAKWFRGEILNRLLSVRSVGNVIPLTYQKSGKGPALMRRVAAKLPDEWVTRGNQSGPLEISVSKRRGFFSERHWNRKAMELRRYIRTDESSTAEHEFMHHIQFADKRMNQLFVDEHARRTSSDRLETLYAHLPNEKGKPDGYVSRYQGREYNGQPLEVITMSFQALIGEDAYADSLLAKMLTMDQDMLSLTLGTIFHYKP